MTEEDFIKKMWAEHDADMKQYHAECERVNNRILSAIRSVKGTQFYSDLEAVMEWVEPSGKMEIVNEPSGDIQSERYGTITRVWVDQWSVGDSGDSFTGNIYVKIKLNKWLKLHFEC